MYSRFWITDSGLEVIFRIQNLEFGIIADAPGYIADAESLGEMQAEGFED